MTGSLIIAAFLSHAAPIALWKALLLPGLPAGMGAYSAVLLVMALIGTEACSLTDLTHSCFLRAKGWAPAGDQPRQRFDLFASMACIFLLGTLVQIAAAASIHPRGLNRKNADDLVSIYSQSLGVAGRLISGAAHVAQPFPASSEEPRATRGRSPTSSATGCSIPRTPTPPAPPSPAAETR